QNAIAITYLANSWKIAIRRYQCSSRCTTDRFHDKGKDGFRPFPADGLFEHVRVAQPAFLERHFIHIPMDHRRWYQRHSHTHWRERSGQYLIAGRFEGTQGDPVIGWIPSDDLPAAGLSSGDSPLSRELHCRFDSLRPARDKVYAVKTRGKPGCEFS